MSLGISVDVEFRLPSNAPARLEGVADQIMQERLQEALANIRTWWPVDTGRSYDAWSAPRRNALMSFRIVNDAAEEGEQYAGYVFRKGDPTRTPLEGRVRDEIRAAMERIRIDILRFRQTGQKVTLPSLGESVVDQLRAALRRRLVASSLRRVIQTRALVA